MPCSERQGTAANSKDDGEAHCGSTNHVIATEVKQSLAECGFADFNGDGLLDTVYSPLRGDMLQLFLNTGRRDGGMLPVFEGGRPGEGRGYVPKTPLYCTGIMGSNAACCQPA